MKKKAKRQIISISLDEQTINALTYYCKGEDLPRSRAVERLIRKQLKAELDALMNRANALFREG